MFLALIGYRGSGKSAVAEHLAHRLHWHWIDADAEIESRVGKSIADIFAQDGEHAFRTLEMAVLSHLLHRANTILALGGGAVLREENRRHLREACAAGGKVIWLKASPETLWRRVQADATTAARRPNLTVAGGLNEIHELLAHREELYRQCADHTIDTDGKPLEQVAEEIQLWFQSSCTAQPPAEPGAAVAEPRAPDPS
jgi:shikimate kinase